MAGSLTLFEAVSGVDGVFCVRKGTLRCTAIQLKDETFALFSPLAGLDHKAWDSLKHLGDVSFLIAPNHYHNKGLAEAFATFPQAVLVSSENARPRLIKVTGFTFNGLDALLTLLPENISVLVPEGLKTGELWLRIEMQDDQICWLVVDAFCTMKANAKKTVSDVPEILGTFPKMGVADKTVYVPWVEQQIRKDTPRMIVPCHGSLIQADDLSTRLRLLMNATF